MVAIFLIGGVRIKEYAAGVAVANGPALILHAFRDLIQTQLSLFYQLLLLGSITLMSSALAGFFIMRNTMHLQTAVTTGFFSYILYIIILQVMGLRGIQLENLVTFTGFVAGGALGAIFWKIRERYTSFPYQMK